MGEAVALAALGEVVLSPLDGAVMASLGLGDNVAAPAALGKYVVVRVPLVEAMPVPALLGPSVLVPSPSVEAVLVHVTLADDMPAPSGVAVVVSATPGDAVVVALTPSPPAEAVLATAWLDVVAGDAVVVSETMGASVSAPSPPAETVVVPV